VSGVQLKEIKKIVLDDRVFKSPRHLKEKGRPVVALSGNKRFPSLLSLMVAILILWFTSSGFQLEYFGHSFESVRLITSHIRNTHPNGVYLIGRGKLPGHESSDILEMVLTYDDFF
jgi:hypothetical protein